MSQKLSSQKRLTNGGKCWMRICGGKITRKPIWNWSTIKINDKKKAKTIPKKHLFSWKIFIQYKKAEFIKQIDKIFQVLITYYSDAVNSGYRCIEIEWRKNNHVFI